MKRKPRVKILSVKRLELDSTTSAFMERMYIPIKEREAGMKLYYVVFSTRTSEFDKMTPALDEMDAMRQAISVMTELHRREHKLNRYGCPK